MPHWSTRLPLAGLLLAAVFFISVGVRTLGDTTMAMLVSSFVMFAACLASAAHLLGLRAALLFAAIAIALGWFAEQMGSSYGWFFGSYDYTDVLGPRVGDVPLVIPLMWFALTYMGYVIANLIIWRAPADGSTHLGEVMGMSLLAAMIVTAYDLGADPYMVFVLKAWIMTKKDGAWFGETVQGFVGWMFVSFCIVLVFRLVVRKLPIRPATGVDRRPGAAAGVDLCRPDGIPDRRRLPGRDTFHRRLRDGVSGVVRAGRLAPLEDPRRQQPR